MDAANLQSFPPRHDFLVEARLIKPDLAIILDQKDIILGRDGFEEAWRSNAEIDLPIKCEMTMQHFKGEHRDTIIVEGLKP